MIRKSLSIVSVLVALLAFSSVASAQTVDEIVAKNLAAKGGLEKLKGIQTLRSTGSMSSQGRNVSVVFTSKRPNMTRQEIVMNGQTMLMVFDGTVARMINPMVSPTAVDMPSESLDMIKDQSDIDGPLIDYKAKGSQIDFVSTDTVEGKKVLHLRVRRKQMPEQDVFLDATTYLEWKVTTTVPGSGVFETIFGDYRTVEGMTMPFSIKTLAAGMTVSEMKLDKIEVNIPLNDAVFKIK